ncbi:hypothetical protein QQ045_031156 [Rhodiola kirilowii]
MESRDLNISMGRTSSNSNDQLSELSEFEIWNSGPDPRRSVPGLGFGSRIVSKKCSSGGSLPVNVPEWSANRRGKICVGVMEEDEDEEAENRIPPHEMVARRARSKRTASYSMHEGIGRTLKGRDLSRVRNAIWEKIGFQD